MFRRFTISNPAMVPKTLSDHLDIAIFRFIVHFSGKPWLDPLRDFKVLKTLINIRLSDFAEQIALHRYKGNRAMIDRCILKHCKIMKNRLTRWNRCKEAMFETFKKYNQGEELKQMMEAYVQQMFAKTYLFTVAAIHVFDNVEPDLTPELHFIYDSDTEFDLMAEIFESSQECFYDWKKYHANDRQLVREVSDFINYLEERLQIKPLKKVRFNI